MYHAREFAMEKPYVGAVKCDVSCEREDGRSILVKCWIIREDANNSRVVKVGLPRGDENEAVVPNHLIQAKCFADGVKRVPDGKTFPRTGTYAGDRVYVIGRGTNNTRICEIERTGRLSWLVPTEDVTNIVTEISAAT
jgi:hypothetical protein